MFRENRFIPLTIFDPMLRWHNVLVAQVSTQVFGTMEEPLLGQTASAATPAAVAAAMPRCGGAAQRRGEITSQANVAEVEGAS